MAHTAISSIARILVSAQCGNFCVATDDGEIIFNQIKTALAAGKSVEVSFAGVESLSTAFLNSAIGDLVGVFSPDDLNARLKIEDMSDDDRDTLNRVIANAKRYYADPDNYRALQRELEAA